MKAAIRYYSKLGHTRDITNAMGEELDIDAISIVDEPLLNENIELIGTYFEEPVAVC